MPQLDTARKVVPGRPRPHRMGLPSKQTSVVTAIDGCSKPRHTQLTLQFPELPAPCAARVVGHELEDTLYQDQFARDAGYSPKQPGLVAQ